MNKYFLYISLSILLACKEKAPLQEIPKAIVNENEIILTEEQFKLAGISTSTIVKGSLEDVVKVNAKIDVPPQQKISVTTPFGGYLKQTPLLPGAKVKKGQVLAVLEDPYIIKLQEEYLITKSNLALAETEYQRQKGLSATQASSTKLYQQAEAEMEALQIRLSAIQENLQLMHISPASINRSSLQRTMKLYSPIDGYVTAVNVNIGKYVTNSEVLFELVDPTAMYMNAGVFEKDLAYLRLGKIMEAKIVTRPDKIYQCKVFMIGKQVQNSGMVEVLCKIENVDNALVPGLYMAAQFTKGDAQHFLMPEAAIVPFGEKNYVFVDMGNRKYSLVEVTTEHTNQGLTAIANGSGLVGKNIVVNGAYTLLMKMKNTEE